MTDETHVTTSQKTRNVSQCKRVFQEQFLLVATFISSTEEESTKHRLYKNALDHARRCLINYEVKYYRLLKYEGCGWVQGLECIPVPGQLRDVLTVPE